MIGCLDLADYCMRTLGLQDEVTYRLSKWDPSNKEKYLGDEAYWEKTQDTIRRILAVSYTHLDVYKRQASRISGSISIKCMTRSNPAIPCWYWLVIPAILRMGSVR